MRAGYDTLTFIMRIAVFDIGTNSIHMKVVEVSPDLSFEVLEHEKDMTRIGDGSFRSGKLSKSAMRRALKVLTRFTRLAKAEGAEKMIAVATSAVRDAKNGPQFVRLVLKKTGLRVRIVSGREEGRLIFLGASSDPQTPRGKVLVVDIGGGSAEFILGSRKKIDTNESFPLGVARLTDRFITKDPPSKENLRNLEEYLEEKLSEALKSIGKNKFSIRVVGTGGTIINLASIVYQANEARRLRLHDYFELKKKQFLKIHRKIIRMNSRRLRELPGLDRKRSDIILAGSLLVSLLMERLKKDRFFVSDKGVREGVILDFMMKSLMKMKNPKPSLRVRWLGQKPFFSGKILLTGRD